MSLKRLPVLETKKVYVDALMEWVDVPIFEQNEVIKLVNEIDWDGLDMWQYKKNLIEHWHGLPATVKSKAKNPVVRDELYEALVYLNWGLKPGKALDEMAFYTRTEAENVTMWFASGKALGQPPEVIHGVSD